MTRSPIRSKDAQSPDRIFSNLLKDYVDGRLGASATFLRASVVSIDQVGGQLETEPAINPPNSIKARIITDALDKNTSDEDLQVFWPMFPHHILPIKEGEHVLVVFEDLERSHGMWITRIPEPNNTNSANLSPGIKKYEENPDNDFTAIGAEQAVQDTDEPPTVVEPSSEFVAEEVPSFRPRVGDHCIEGSNNTIIVLGRDRPTVPESGEIGEAGTIDLVVGRTGTNPDISADKSRVYISMNSDIDTNFGVDVGPSAAPTAAIGIKSNEIRIIARNGMKLIVEGGDIHIDGGNIFLGKDATESVMQGNLFNKLWRRVLFLIANHIHPSPVPMSPATNLAELVTSNIDLDQPATGPVNSKTVKAKK